MERRYLQGSIALSKLKSVITERKGKSGMIKGVFIPFDVNHLSVKDNAVYLPITVGLASEEDQHGQIAYVKQNVDSATYKEADEEKKKEFKELPFLGNFKEFNRQSSNDATQEVAEEDDLPF